MMAEAKKILFICTGNSIRSQMAEGFMKALGGEDWNVQSAGVLPSYVHPLAVRVMMEIGIDISDQKSKSVDKFVNEAFDIIITLCDNAAASCPTFPGQGKRLHWPIEDPVGAMGSTEERLVLFRKARDQIKKKIEDFLKSESK
ncbi:MAG: arsenate reductase ArsC [Deltaproteobacteria bacterium]